jgi:hypothetical protein
MNILAEDMQLICTLSTTLQMLFAKDNIVIAESKSQSSTICCNMLVQADEKLQADTAAFMRSALQMYNLMETSSDNEGFPYYLCPLHITQEMASFIDDFVRSRVDPVILSPCLNVAAIHCRSEQQQYTPDIMKNVGIARDHCLLLASTLRAMVQETFSWQQQQQQMSCYSTMPATFNEGLPPPISSFSSSAFSCRKKRQR